MAQPFTEDELDILRKAAQILRRPNAPAALSSLPLAVPALNPSAPTSPATTYRWNTSNPNQPGASSVENPGIYENRSHDLQPSTHVPDGSSADPSYSSHDPLHPGIQDANISQDGSSLLCDVPPETGIHFSGREQTGSELFMSLLDLQSPGPSQQHQQNPSSGVIYEPSLEPEILDCSAGDMDPVTTSQPIGPLVARATAHSEITPNACSMVKFGLGFGDPQASNPSIGSSHTTNEPEFVPNTMNPMWLQEGFSSVQQSMHSGQRFVNPNTHHPDKFLLQFHGEGTASFPSPSRDNVNSSSGFACDETVDFEYANAPLLQQSGYSDESWLDEIFPEITMSRQIPHSLLLQNDIITGPSHPRPQYTEGGLFSLSRPGPQRTKRPQAKRGPYQEADRRQTALTRTIRGCIRCRMNRKRCIPDPENPMGPCLTCQKTIFNTFRLPCLRYKIVDSTLFRTASNSAYEGRFPNVGPKYGTFHIPRAWVSESIKVFEITQDRGTVLRFKVRQFEPAEEPATDSKGIGGKGRKMFAVPWALTDAETGVDSLNTFIEESIDHYIHSIVNKTSLITWNVFQAASGLASGAGSNHFIRDVLRLWTACRFIEGGWRCSGAETLGAERLGTGLRPAWWISPPPFIDYQFASIVMHRILPPLRHKVLKSLEDLILANKAGNWFTIFLAVFILLHNYELIMAHEVQFACKRKYQVRYVDMNLVRGALSGSKTLLAHFHYVCKGNFPFQSNFDWKAKTHRRMAQLDAEHYISVASSAKDLRELPL